MIVGSVLALLRQDQIFIPMHLYGENAEYENVVKD